MLTGNGDATFQPRGTFSVPEKGYAAEIGDFNNDGMLDLVTANGNNGTSTVLLGNGDGSFRSGRTLVPSGPSVYSVDVGDFNGDGMDDIAATSAVAPFMTECCYRGLL